MPDLVVQREDVGFESVVPRERDALRCRVTGEQPRLDPENCLGTSQAKHGKLRATGLENPNDSVDAHCHSMRSASKAAVNNTVAGPWPGG
jgi:hypothetical protein